MKQNLPLVVLLNLLFLASPNWVAAQCAAPGFDSQNVTGTNSATICWQSAQSDVDDHQWNLLVDDVTIGVDNLLDLVVEDGTAGLSVAGTVICYNLSLPYDDTEYLVAVSELCDGGVAEQSASAVLFNFTTNAAAPPALAMPTVFKTINQTVTHTASFTDIQLDPNPLVGEASRLQFTRDLLSDVNNIGQPGTGQQILFQIIENILNINIPNWIKTAGSSVGVPGVISFSLTPTLNIGITADYGGFIGLGAVGKADVDVNYPVDITIRAPGDQEFGCGDKIVLETSATRGNGATIDITPAFYETELGPIFENVSFKIEIGLVASIEIGCVAGECAYENDWNLLDEVGIPNGELLNIPIATPDFPAFLQLCEDAFDNNANLGTLGDCVAGTSIFEDIVDILSTSPNTAQALASLASFSNNEVSLSNPDLPSAANIDIPEFSGTFMKVRAQDLSQTTDGNKLRVEVDGGKFEELSKLRLDLISLIDYAGVPTSYSLGAGLGEVDLGDLNINLTTDLILDYEFDPDFYTDIDLGEPMTWRVYNPNNGTTIATNTSQVIPNVLMGYDIEVELPADYDQTATIDETLKMSADFTTESQLMYNNSLSMSFLQLESNAADFAIALVPEFEIVENEMPGSPKTIEDHTLNWGTNLFNQPTESFSIVPDQTAPTVVCQNTTVVLNDWGTASILPEDVYNAGSSFDAPLSGTGTVKLLSVFPNSFNCDDLSGTTVTLTAEDENCNMSTCTASVTVLDESRPEINCAPNFVQENDFRECGAVIDVPEPEVYDNCATTLRARYRPVDDNNNSLGPWSAWTSNPDGFYAVGRWRVQWQAKDASNNQRRCNIYFDVIDTEKPVLNCFDPTYVFNGQASLDLILADFSTAMDNCAIAVHEIDLDVIFCEQLGEILTVTSTAIDIYDNTSTCTSTLTIDGLPCGWSQQPDGVGCVDGNDVDYDVPTEVFTVNSADCQNSITTDTDEYAFGQYNLCGDGELVAQVTSISGTSTGWAGITMREGNDPQGKAVSLMTNLFTSHRTELRLEEGGDVTSSMSASFNRHWLRLVRSGPYFTGYASSNGFTWFRKFSILLPMDDCIEMGLIVNSASSSGDQTATFANVEATGTTFFELSAIPETRDRVDFGDRAVSSFQVYPNPTTGEFWADFGDFLDQEASLEIFNVNGERVQAPRNGLIDLKREQLDLHGLPAGLYFVRLRTADGSIQTKRLILQPRP